MYTTYGTFSLATGDACDLTWAEQLAIIIERKLIAADAKRRAVGDLRPAKKDISAQ